MDIISMIFNKAPQVTKACTTFHQEIKASVKGRVEYINGTSMLGACPRERINVDENMDAPWVSVGVDGVPTTSVYLLSRAIQTFFEKMNPIARTWQRAQQEFQIMSKHGMPVVDSSFRGRVDRIRRITCKMGARASRTAVKVEQTDVTVA
jgi:hypothetical protein